MVTIRTNVELWMSGGVCDAASTAIYQLKEVAGKIFAKVAGSKSNTLFATQKAKCVWLGAVTSMQRTTRFTMASYLCPVIAPAVIVTVSTQNT